MRLLRFGAITALLMLGSFSALHAQREPIPLNDYQRLGQRFTVTRPFHMLWVTVPSWSDTEGGLTLSLWDSPRRTRRLAKRAFTDVTDNAAVELPLPRPLPAGTYYWEVDARIGQTRIGLYADRLPSESADCIYRDGAPDRTRRFVFGTMPTGLLRSEAPRLIAVLKSGSPQEQSDACRQLAVIGGREAIPALARLLPDLKRSHMARFALEAMPYPEADAALRAALKTLKGPPLIGVINSIAIRRDPKAVGPLTFRLRGANPQAAAAAAIALGRIGTPGAADALERALREAPPALRPAVYEGGLHCAGGLAVGGRRERAIALYDRLRAAPASRAIRAAAMRGAIVTRGSQGLPLLLQQLRGADSVMAGVALWVVQRDVPGTRVTQALAAELGKLPAERQALLAQALAWRGDRAALPALEAAARSGPRPVRLAALRALPRLDSVTAAQALVRAQEEADPEITQASQDGLNSLSENAAANAARRLLARPDARSRIAGLTLVHTKRLPGFTPRLLSVIRSAEPQVRLAALKALGELAGAEALPGLLDALTAVPDLPTAVPVGQALAAVCARADNPQACGATLAARMATAHPAQKIVLLRVLGEIGGATAMQSVRGALGDADGAVRAAALDALCGWKTADAADDLLRLAREANAPADRLRALRGLLRLAADPDVPAERRLSACREAGGLAQRDEEKRLLLGALGGLAAPEALEMAAHHLEDPAIKEEACAAVVGIAGRLPGGLGESARKALERAAQVTASPDLAARARALLQPAQSRP